MGWICVGGIISSTAHRWFDGRLCEKHFCLMRPLSRKVLCLLLAHSRWREVARIRPSCWNRSLANMSRRNQSVPWVLPRQIKYEARTIAGPDLLREMYMSQFSRRNKNKKKFVARTIAEANMQRSHPPRPQRWREGHLREGHLKCPLFIFLVADRQLPSQKCLAKLLPISPRE